MWVNMHTMPFDKDMYTVYVTPCPSFTPESDLLVDELDVIADRYASIAKVVEAAELDKNGYEGQRVIALRTAPGWLRDRQEGHLRPADPAGRPLKLVTGVGP